MAPFRAAAALAVAATSAPSSRPEARMMGMLISIAILAAPKRSYPKNRAPVMQMPEREVPGISATA